MTGPYGDEIMDEMARLRGTGEAFALATVVRTRDATSAKAGAKAIVRQSGDIVGWIGSGCVQGAVRKAAAEVITGAEAHLIRVRPKDQVVAPVDVDGVELHKSACPSGGTVEIFVEAMLPRPQLVVFGASPVGVAVAELGRRLGFSLVVLAPDDMQARFAEADIRKTDYGLEDLARPEQSFIVVATQGRRDREALAAALRSSVPYVAFVGSGKKAEVLCVQLLELGLEKSLVARLKAPAGLNIGAIGHEEIALSILAEITELRRRNVNEAGVAAGGEASSTPQDRPIESASRTQPAKRD
ncbi:XdhC family protein [Pelagibius sp. Alg239-R121]|uniref:XdhC family protein n=1 Tax=Pelagibius sp. Alg239-R121 TaxID=2993448 RepID=UPI0024A641F0|nr:XdhC family protein [Pelagibius sp. Alg239-R121]